VFTLWQQQHQQHQHQRQLEQQEQEQPNAVATTQNLLSLKTKRLNYLSILQYRSSYHVATSVTYQYSDN
jgi:hypothetical protein